MPRSRPAMLIAAILIALTLMAIACLAPRQYPLHTDSAANFWGSVADADIGGTEYHGSEVILDRDRVVYGFQFPFAPYVDRPYYTVSLDEIQRAFPAVERELQRRVALNNPKDWAARAYKRWKAHDEAESAKPNSYRPWFGVTLIEVLACMDYERSHSDPPDDEPRIPYALRPGDFQTGLLHVADAARLYWATIAFEVLFFPALILFTLWPWIHRQPFRRKLLHTALTPFLLFLPAWLGYCNSGSPAYPLGGVLYPYVNSPIAAPIENASWEFGFLSHLPPLFYPITQGRTLTYAEYYRWRDSIPRQAGPINVAVLSSLAILLLLTAKGTTWLYQKLRPTPRGFPVLLGSDGNA